MLFPLVCPVCERPGPAPCGPCIARLTPVGEVPGPSGIDRCCAAVAYEDEGRLLVGALKFRRARDVAGWLAAAMAALVVGEALDVVTWAPTTRRHRAERGYDQAELLARRVARRLGLPAQRTIRRVGDRPQTGLHRAERIAGPVFIAERRVRGSVLVVDDVITTGATLSAAAAALRAGGADGVVALVAAATPPPEVRRAPTLGHVPTASREAARGGHRQQSSSGDLRPAS